MDSCYYNAEKDEENTCEISIIISSSSYILLLKFQLCFVSFCYSSIHFWKCSTSTINSNPSLDTYIHYYTGRILLAWVCFLMNAPGLSFVSLDWLPTKKFLVCTLGDKFKDSLLLMFILIWSTSYFWPLNFPNLINHHSYQSKGLLIIANFGVQNRPLQV